MVRISHRESDGNGGGPESTPRDWGLGNRRSAPDNARSGRSSSWHGTGSGAGSTASTTPKPSTPSGRRPSGQVEAYVKDHAVPANECGPWCNGAGLRQRNTVEGRAPIHPPPARGGAEGRANSCPRVWPRQPHSLIQHPNCQRSLVRRYSFPRGPWQRVSSISVSRDNIRNYRSIFMLPLLRRGLRRGLLLVSFVLLLDFFLALVSPDIGAPIPFTESGAIASAACFRSSLDSSADAVTGSGSGGPAPGCGSLSASSGGRPAPCRS